MQALFFVVRAVVACVPVYFQYQILTTHGILIGELNALLIQSGLYLVAVVIAPPYVRYVMVAVAGWSMIPFGVAMLVAWATAVYPIIMLIAAINGEPGMLIQFLWMTAFMPVPYVMMMLASLLNDEEDALTLDF